eukprot:4482049-Amphidinium_carterae.1
MLPWEHDVKQRLPAFECNGHAFVQANATVAAAFADLPYKAGVQWIALTEDLAVLAVRALKAMESSEQQDSLTEVLLFSQPDESYFQSVLAELEQDQPCHELVVKNIGYSLTWNEPAAEMRPDSNSEVPVASPPLLTHLNDEDDLNLAFSWGWATPAIFARKFDGKQTHPTQDRLDVAMQQKPLWEDVHGSWLSFCQLQA